MYETTETRIHAWNIMRYALYELTNPQSYCGDPPQGISSSGDNSSRSSNSSWAVFAFVTDPLLSVLSSPWFVFDGSHLHIEKVSKHIKQEAVDLITWILDLQLRRRAIDHLGIVPFSHWIRISSFDPCSFWVPRRLLVTDPSASIGAPERPSPK